MKSNDKKVSFLFQTWMVFRNSTPTEYANIWNSGGRSKLISLQVSSPFGVACATDEINDINFGSVRLWNCAKILVLAPPPVYQDVSTRHDWPVIKPLSICQSGWIELRNAFLVILWDRWRPQTRISAKSKAKKILQTRGVCFPRKVFKFRGSKLPYPQ